MFCKYCGEVVNGKECVACGKPVILRDHSRELQKMVEQLKPALQAPVSADTVRGETKDNRFNEKSPDGLTDLFRFVRENAVAVLCGLVFLLGTLFGGIVSYQSGLNHGKEIGEQTARMEAEETMAASRESFLREGYGEGYAAGLQNGLQKEYRTIFNILRLVPAVKPLSGSRFSQPVVTRSMMEVFE